MDHLHQRFLAHFVEQDVVGHLEAETEELDLGRVRVAICFADLAGYTRLTEEDGEESALDTVERFVQTYRLSFPVLPDPELQVAGRYRVTGYPETFVIDRNGTIVAHEIGPRHWDAPDSVAAFRALIERGEWSGLS